MNTTTGFDFYNSSLGCISGHFIAYSSLATYQWNSILILRSRICVHVASFHCTSVLSQTNNFCKTPNHLYLLLVAQLCLFVSVLSNNYASDEYAVFLVQRWGFVLYANNQSKGMLCTPHSHSHFLHVVTFSNHKGHSIHS